MDEFKTNRHLGFAQRWQRRPRESGYNEVEKGLGALSKIANSRLSLRESCVSTSRYSRFFRYFRYFRGAKGDFRNRAWAKTDKEQTLTESMDKGATKTMTEDEREGSVGCTRRLISSIACRRKESVDFESVCREHPELASDLREVVGCADRDRRSSRFGAYPVGYWAIID